VRTCALAELWDGREDVAGWRREDVGIGGRDRVGLEAWEEVVGEGEGRVASRSIERRGERVSIAVFEKEAS